LQAISPEVKLIFLCSPGNPTAKALPLEDIEAVAGSAAAQNAIVVVDEAYVDFSTKGSAVSILSKYPNVVVLQTLSKAFGLAAIRCGFCLGAPDVIQLMNNVKAPYNVNVLTSKLALAAFDSIHVLEGHIATTLAERTKMTDALAKLAFVVEVFPSDSNFLLVRLTEKAAAVYKTMADGGVVVRFRGNEMHCSECLRMTIGTPEENQTMLTRIQEVYASLN
jgi:histidinol-phosphate aminotransferase